MQGCKVARLAIALSMACLIGFAPLGAAPAEEAGVSLKEEPFLLCVEEGAPERGAERFQRIFIISLPFSMAYSYGLCYLAAGIEQKDKTPDLYDPRDYKPYMFGGAVVFSLGISIFDQWWRRRGAAWDEEQDGEAAGWLRGDEVFASPCARRALSLRLATIKF